MWQNGANLDRAVSSNLELKVGAFSKIWKIRSALSRIKSGKSSTLFMYYVSGNFDPLFDEFLHAEF